MTRRSPEEPERECALCPRLAAFRAGNRASFADFHNAPVPSFGGLDARLLVVGLAPGLKGANRTGRPFTGDHAGRLLYETLGKFGFAAGRYEERPDDGLGLIDARVTNAVRCVPPENKPTPAETASCRRFLAAEIAALPRLGAILCLGNISHASVLVSLGLKPTAYRFGHGAEHPLPVRAPASSEASAPRGERRDKTIHLFDSYHCSRLNTNTGRLTPAMFEAVFTRIRAHLDRP